MPYCVGNIFLFYVGLVVHDFEEDLEFGEFAFILKEKALVFLRQSFQPDINFELSKR